MSNILDGLVVPTIEEMIDRYCGPCVISVERDCIVLGNIGCTGSDGQVFEHYNKLRVDKDIARGQDGKQVYFRPYIAAAHFESEGKSLPSFALSCNILKVLYENKGDKEVSKALMQYKQYKDNGYGFGWHAQNTIADYGNSKIIHYPSDSDLPHYCGGGSNINKGKRIELAFNNKGFENMPLEEALNNPDFKNYIMDLTGLQQPETLIEIGKHFKKPAHIWVSSRGVRAAWLGCCNYLGFCIGVYDNLGSNIVARGVSNP